MRWRRSLLACLLALPAAIPAPARAASRSLTLDPRDAVVGFRAFALGLFPKDGVFTRFSGTLLLDDAAPGWCQVTLRVEVASLEMPDADARSDVLSASLMNAAAYPMLVFHGGCAGGGMVAGQLDMHGERHDLALAVSRQNGLVQAQARLRRADWGVRGRPMLAGPVVRIRLTTHLPIP